MPISAIRLSFWFLFLTKLAASATLEVHLATPAAIRERLERGTVTPSTRQSMIQSIFQDVGCAATEQRVSRKEANVICTLPGETDSTVIIGAHFDFAEHGHGIVDDWSGTALLPSLYEAIKEKPRLHTFVFVAFAAEERGLVGSSLYVKTLSKEERSRVQAFVNLECLGLGPTNIWVHRAAPALVARAATVASAVHIPVREVDVENVGDDDSHPFVSARMPVITMHSITQQTFGILHSDKDQVGAIVDEAYYSSYKFLAFYLASLDSNE